MKPPKRPLSVMDSTFLRIETTDTPMHVGALMEFALPDNAGEDFVSTVVAKLREPLPLRQPFNQRLVRTATLALAPAATAVESIDMEYHPPHCAAAPGQ